MDVRFSAEQQALRASAAQVVDRFGPRAVGALDDKERRHRLNAAVASSGWRELRVGTDGGGPLASGVEVAIVAEELGRGLADVAFLGPTLAAELRRRAGAPPGTGAETVALDTDVSSLAWVVGDRVPTAVAIDALDARRALTLVPSSTGYRLAEVALQPVLTQLDLTRPTAVPDPSMPAVLVAEPAAAVSDDDLTAWLALGIALTCADLVGVMGGAVQLARDYATNRRQFDAPIGSYQSVQHLLADAYVALEGSRSVTLHAAWAVDSLAPHEALAAAALAKAYCARAARTVCETAIQVHGGIGHTWECLAHVYLRRALSSSDLLGGAEASLGRVLAHQGIGEHDGLR